MNPSPGPDIDVKPLLALRRDNDAVRLITERLLVKKSDQPTTSAPSMRLRHLWNPVIPTSPRLCLGMRTNVVN